MAFKALCTLTLLIQTALGQCSPLGGCGCGFVPAASTGGSFVVTSASPVAPTGVSVVSENLYEGALIIEGNLPLLGSVALEGTMGTAGAGAVSYGCGDGSVGIVAEEGPIVTGIAPEAGGCHGHGFGYGLGNGLGNCNGNCCYGNGRFGNGHYGLGYGYGNGRYGFGGRNGFCGFGGYGRFGGYGGFGYGCGCGLGGIY